MSVPNPWPESKTNSISIWKIVARQKVAMAVTVTVIAIDIITAKISTSQAAAAAAAVTKNVPEMIAVVTIAARKSHGTIWMTHNTIWTIILMFSISFFHFIANKPPNRNNFWILSIHLKKFIGSTIAHNQLWIWSQHAQHFNCNILWLIRCDCV